MENNTNTEAKKKSKKKTIIIVLVVFLLLGGIIGSNTEEGTETTDTNNNKQTKETTQKSNTTTEKKKTTTKKEVFKWEATGDIRIEDYEETKVLEVGKDIEAGEYKIEYSYKDYDSISVQTTMKYNRTYFVYISNLKLDNVNGENVNKLENNILDEHSFHPNKYIDKTADIKVESGNYIYIYHTANKEAGYGTIKIISK